MVISSDIKKSLNEEWNTVKIISKAGKTTGRFKNCYNVKGKYLSYYLNLDEIFGFEKLQNNSQPQSIEEDILQK